MSQIEALHVVISMFSGMRLATATKKELLDAAVAEHCKRDYEFDNIVRGRNYDGTEHQPDNTFCGWTID